MTPAPSPRHETSPTPGLPGLRRNALGGVLGGVLAFVLAGCGGEFTPSAGGHEGHATTLPVRPVGSPAPEPPVGGVPEDTADDGSDDQDGTAEVLEDGTGSNGDGHPEDPDDVQAAVVSDVRGRNFDLGTIVSTFTAGGTQVIELDRWRVAGISDDTLARDGIDLTPHTTERFVNDNGRTFRIPVAAGAQFFLQTCVDPEEPADIEDSDLRAFSNLQPPENVILLVLDAQGHAIVAYNDPVCDPGD